MLLLCALVSVSAFLDPHLRTKPAVRSRVDVNRIVMELDKADFRYGHGRTFEGSGQGYAVGFRSIKSSPALDAQKGYEGAQGQGAGRFQAGSVVPTSTAALQASQDAAKAAWLAKLQGPQWGREAPAGAAASSPAVAPTGQMNAAATTVVDLHGGYASRRDILDRSDLVLG